MLDRKSGGGKKGKSASDVSDNSLSSLSEDRWVFHKFFVVYLLVFMHVLSGKQMRN